MDGLVKTRKASTSRDVTCYNLEPWGHQRPHRKIWLSHLGSEKLHVTALWDAGRRGAYGSQ
eukprot:3381716-Pyramimonas_sp.AAC.1